MRPARLIRGRRTLPTQRPPAKLALQEAEPLQFFLKGGRENSESDCRPSLISARGEKGRNDQAFLETGQKISKRQTLCDWRLKGKPRVE